MKSGRTLGAVLALIVVASGHLLPAAAEAG
jgi:hypothetical protein